MKLSFVIPTVNQYKMLFEDCIDSFVRHNGKDHEIIVVDDGSTRSQDGTVGNLPEIIKAECERRGIKFLSNEKNSGFAVTVNKGIAAASGDVIVVVNNDIKFTQNVTIPLSNSFSDPKTGIVGGLLFYPNGTIQHGGIDVVNGDGFTHRGWHGTISQFPIVAKPAYTVGVTGAVFALKREMINQIGAFKEDYFLACEDTEFCLRAWSNGWRVFYNPTIQAIHLEGATRGRTDVEKQRKHRDWFIKEQKTFQKFRNDLKSYNIPEIIALVSEANMPSDRKPQPKVTSSERIVFKGEPASESVSPQASVETIVIRRSGALGDVLMATGVVRNIKKLNLGKKVVVATDCPDAVRGNKYVDAVVPARSVLPSSSLIDLDLTYEKNPKKEVWKTYAEAAGLSGDLDLSFDMDSGQRELDSVVSKLPGVSLGKEKVAVLHMGISWQNRTWPRNRWLEVSRSLSASGYKVVTVGKGSDFKSDMYANVINMVDRFTIPEIRELCKKASVFVGVDSGILHVAQTTDVPIVGIFTVANPQYRVYPRSSAKTVAIVPKMECRFCLHEQEPPVTFVGCKWNTNACLTEISSNDVLSAIQESAR